MVRHLTARSREELKSRYWGFDYSNYFKIWQTLRQEHCREICQISERYELFMYNTQSRGFKASLDLRKTPCRLVNKGLDLYVKLRLSPVFEI